MCVFVCLFVRVLVCVCVCPHVFKRHGLRIGCYQRIFGDHVDKWRWCHIQFLYYLPHFLSLRLLAPLPSWAPPSDIYHFVVEGQLPYCSLNRRTAAKRRNQSLSLHALHEPFGHHFGFDSELIPCWLKTMITEQLDTLEMPLWRLSSSSDPLSTSGRDSCASCISTLNGSFISDNYGPVSTLARSSHLNPAPFEIVGSEMSNRSDSLAMEGNLLVEQSGNPHMIHTHTKDVHVEENKLKGHTVAPQVASTGTPDSQSSRHHNKKTVAFAVSTTPDTDTATLAAKSTVAISDQGVASSLTSHPVNQVHKPQRRSIATVYQGSLLSAQGSLLAHMSKEDYHVYSTPAGTDHYCLQPLNLIPGSRLTAFRADIDYKAQRTSEKALLMLSRPFLGTQRQARLHRPSLLGQSDQPACTHTASSSSSRQIAGKSIASNATVNAAPRLSSSHGRCHRESVTTVACHTLIHPLDLSSAYGHIDSCGTKEMTTKFEYVLWYLSSVHTFTCLTFNSVYVFNLYFSIFPSFYLPANI